MRVLHLIDPQSPDGGPCTLRLLADVMQHLQSAEHATLIIGTSRCVATARRCGVDPDGALCPPRAVPWAAGDLLRKFLAAKRSAGAPYDVIHAWTARSAALAASVAKKRPNLATLHVGPRVGLGAAYALRIISEAIDQPLLAASTAVRKEFRARGIDHQRLTLLPPAVDPHSTAIVDRELVRQRWSEDSDLAIEDDTFVIGLLGEPANWSDVRGAATMVCRARLTGRNVKLLVAPDTGSAGSRLETQKIIRDLSIGDVMVIDDAATDPWRIVKGLDAALVLGSGCRARPASSALPLLWAMAAGVPAIAEASDAFGDVVEDGVSGWLIAPGDVNAAADRIVRMFDDRQLAAALGEGGRSAAHDTFHIEAYCVRLWHAYELLLADSSIRTLETSPARNDADADAPALV